MRVLPERDIQHHQQEDLRLLSLSLVSAAIVMFVNKKKLKVPFFMDDFGVFFFGQLCLGRASVGWGRVLYNQLGRGTSQTRCKPTNCELCPFIYYLLTTESGDLIVGLFHCPIFSF